MSYPYKDEVLATKYAYIPDDAANAPARKQKKTVKKANHKHDYGKSIIINYYDKYAGKWTYAYRNVYQEDFPACQAQLVRFCS